MTNHKQTEFNLQTLKKRMNYYHKEIVNDADSIGMTLKTLEKLVEGKNVIVCPQCHTPNMYGIVRSKDVKFTIYECGKCGKTYTDDQKK